MKTIPVAILGATGMVGQRIIAMLAELPQFQIAELAASGKNVGKSYKEACTWRTEVPCPQEVVDKKLCSLLDVESPYVISALPAEIAIEVEPELARRGINVFSNASALRMRADVPLLVPELNRSHLSLANTQTTAGKIITNPNCSTVFITAGLAPLLELGQIEHVHITTLQATSGAGYPGVPSFDMIGNVVPFIPSEEEKIEEEVKKILGKPNEPQTFPVTVNCTRVPVLHGHTTILQVRFESALRAETVLKKFQALSEEAPEFYHLIAAETGPQAARCLTWNDQKVYIGRIKQGGDAKTISLISMGHNLVRGAAGATIVNLQAFLRETQKWG